MIDSKPFLLLSWVLVCDYYVAVPSPTTWPLVESLVLGSAVWISLATCSSSTILDLPWGYVSMVHGCMCMSRCVPGQTGGERTAWPYTLKKKEEKSSETLMCLLCTQTSISWVVAILSNFSLQHLINCYKVCRGSLTLTSVTKTLHNPACRGMVAKQLP